MEPSSPVAATRGGPADTADENRELSSRTSPINTSVNPTISSPEDSDHGPDDLKMSAKHQLTGPTWAKAEMTSTVPTESLEVGYAEKCAELWDSAYDSLKADYPTIMAEYEEKLTQKAPPASRWSDRSYTDGYLTPDIICQTDAKRRRQQMYGIMRFWLDYMSLSESADLELRDEDLDYWPRRNGKYTSRLRAIAGIIEERNISEWVPFTDIALLASCLAVESICESEDPSGESFDHVVDIISCMKWYNTLPQLLLSKNDFDDDRNGNLQSNILELYKAVLLYPIQVVCWDLNCPSGKAPDPKSGSTDFQVVTRARNALHSFGDYDAYGELRGIFYIHDNEDNGTKDGPSEEAGTMIDKETDDLLAKLDAIKPEDFDFRIKNDTEDRTLACLYRYISSSPEFASLITVNEESPQILAIKGEPGSGKTLLMRAVHVQLSVKVKQGSHTGIVASYFCGKSHVTSENLLSILKSLIWQSINQQPQLADHLSSKFSDLERDSFNHQNDSIAISSVLHSMLLDYDGDVYFVVDSIDEVTENELSKLLKLISSTMRLSSKVRWIISATEGGYGATYIQLDRKIEFRIDPTHVDMQAAIEEYVSAKVEEIIGGKKCENKFQNQLKLELKRRCEDNFLRVDIACDQIMKHELWNALITLAKLPKGLQELFSYIKSTLQNPESADSKYFNDVFLAVATALRPLHIDELAGLVAFPIRVDLEHILRKCSAFFKFLRGQMKDSVGHYILAKWALERLLQWCENPELKMPTNYVALYWIKHSATAIELRREDDGLMNLTKKLLGSYFRQWTEFLVSTGILLQALDLILEFERAMEKKFSTTDYSNEFLKLIREVHEYLSIHITYEPSEKHAVKTRIIFCPSTSSLRQKTLPSEFPWLQAGLMPEVDWTLKHYKFQYKHEVFKWNYSSDGQFIAAAGYRAVSVYDTATDEPQHLVKYKYQDKIADIAISRAGLLAVACYDKFDVWDINTGLPKRLKLLGEESQINNVNFSPNGAKLAAATSAGTIVWDSLTFDELCWTDYLSITCVVFSPDSKILVAVTGNKMILRTLNNGSESRVFETLEPDLTLWAVAFSLDMKYIATCDSHAKVRIWGLDSGHVLNVLKGCIRQQPLVFLPDGLHLASVSDKGTIMFWQLPWDENKCTVEERWQDLSSVRFSPNGQYMSSYNRIWDLKAACEHAAADNQKSNTNRVLKEHMVSVQFVVFSEDGNLLATGDSNGSIYLWDGNTGDFRSVLFEWYPDHLTSLIFTPDGRHLVFTFYDSPIFKTNISTGEIRVLFGHKAWVKCAASSNDGQFLASGSDNRTIRIWDLNNEEGDVLHMKEQGVILEKFGIRKEREEEQKDQSVAKLEVDDRIFCVAISDGARYVASGGGYGTISLWHISHESGAPKPSGPRSLSNNDDTIYSVAFIRHGEELVSSSYDRTVNIWRTSTGSMIRSISTDQKLYSLRSSIHFPRFILTELGLMPLSPADQCELPGSWPYKIKSDRSWITWRDQNLIFLPDHYRPNHHTHNYKVLTSRIYENRVVIGCASGQVIFFKFDKDAKPFG